MTKHATILQTLSQSNHLLRSNLKFVLTQYLIFVLLYLPVVILSKYVFNDTQQVFDQILSFVSLAIVVWLSLGLTQMFLDLSGSHHKHTKFLQGLKSQSTNFFRVFAATLIKAVINIGIAVVPFLLLLLLIITLRYIDSGINYSQILIMLSVPLGLFILISMLYINIRLYFYEMIIVDKRVNPIKAFSMAMAMTKGRSLQIFGVMAATLVLNLVGILLLFVGSL